MAKPPRVLVVDDEADIRELIENALRRNGFRCETAGDAEQARARIDTSRPDLILLDWRLPGQSGLDLAHSLKQDSGTYSIPIIMLTAHDQESRKIQGFGLSLFLAGVGLGSGTPFVENFSSGIPFIRGASHRTRHGACH